MESKEREKNELRLVCTPHLKKGVLKKKETATRYSTWWAANKDEGPPHYGGYAAHCFAEKNTEEKKGEKKKNVWFKKEDIPPVRGVKETGNGGVAEGEG